jgi:ElaB/YqjD/DUF883 family membrane-anchored ribosome-binding protein
MGTSTDNLQKRGRAAAKKATGAAKEIRSGLAPAIKRGAQTITDKARQVHDLSVNATNSVVAYTKKKPVKALAIAAASGALLHAALKVITPSED